LILRRWTLDDATVMAAGVEESLDHLRPWMSWAGDEPLSADAREELIRRFERRWESGAEVAFGAFLGDTVVGGCGLITRAGGSTLEIGYWVHVDRVGQGFATEMARVLTDAAFTVDGVVRVEIHHDRANLRSRAVAAGLGFTVEGERPDEVMAPAEEGVDCTWFVSRADWVSRRDRRR
jgi:RimJ/RimL family protein N-acetyltransferase